MLTSSGDPTSPGLNSSSPATATSYPSLGLGTSTGPKPTDPAHSFKSTYPTSKPSGALGTGTASKPIYTSFSTSYLSHPADPSSLGPRPSSGVPKPGNYTYPGGPKGTTLTSISTSASGSLFPIPTVNNTGKLYPYPNGTLPSYPTASVGAHSSGVIDPSAAGTSLQGGKSYPYPNGTTSAPAAGITGVVGVSGSASSGYYITVTSRFNVTETLPPPVIGTTTSTALSGTGTKATGSTIAGGLGSYGKPVPVATGSVTPYAEDQKVSYFLNRALILRDMPTDFNRGLRGTQISCSNCSALVEGMARSRKFLTATLREQHQLHQHFNEREKTKGSLKQDWGGWGVHRRYTSFRGNTL